MILVILAAAMEGESRSARRILMIEDDHAVARVTKRFLRDAGFLVTHITDGDEAIERVRYDEPWDVVWCDLHLGGAIDGVDVLRTMRDLLPRALLLLVTGAPDTRRVAELPRGALVFNKVKTVDVVDMLREAP